MDNLIFSLNATIPVFLLMILGLVFRRIGWIDEAFASKLNQFVFRVPLPLLVFEDLATVDFSQIWNVSLCCSALWQTSFDSAMCRDFHALEGSGDPR